MIEDIFKDPLEGLFGERPLTKRQLAVEIQKRTLAIVSACNQIITKLEEVKE